jgi:predicted nucleic acid-binding protein
VETEPVVYADSSALVKLVLDEVESDELLEYLDGGPVIASSRIALVEVSRAATLRDPRAGVPEAVDRLLGGCLLVDVTADLLQAARRLASRTLRSLDAVHLATALRVAPDEFVAYDRRLLAVAAELGLSTAHPGLAAAA